MPPLTEYSAALSIAQDRANRGSILMYIFHLDDGTFYLTTQYEFPFVDRTHVIQVDEIWPNPSQITGEINWTDL